MLLNVGTERRAAPYAVTEIEGSQVSVSAPAQDRGGVLYAFTGWSDGGAASHIVTAPADITATFKKATAARISGTPATITSGEPVTVSGRLVKGTTASADWLPGQPLALFSHQTNTSQPWRQIATVTTNAEGLATSVQRPTVNTEYNWRFAGTAEWAPSATPAFRVTVRTKVTASLDRTRVGVGSPAVLSGTVAPNHAGQNAYLQQLVSAAWRTAQVATLSGSSGFSFTIRRSAAGTSDWRVLKVGDGDHADGASATLRLTVVA
jgi:hypothetical protein